MSLKSYYETLILLRYSQGSYDGSTPSGFNPVRSFQGIIQAPTNSNVYINGKDTSNVAGILFTDVSDFIQEKDKVRASNGKTYIIAGAGSQPKGVTGIKAHHAEYVLEFDNDG